MRFFSAFSRRLYLRIWLAVVACVVVLTLLVGWAWRVAQEHDAPQRLAPREVVVRNAAGEVVGTAQAQPRRGHGIEFAVTLADGQTLNLQLPPRPFRRPDGQPPPQPTPLWLRPPSGFLWLLGVVALAVALGVYPIVRRLTQRLEALQHGVQSWGDGDLSARVAVQGDDEVADLSRRFNAAAHRVQGLLQAQRSLLANASHELRSPLARIRMGLELMEAPGATPDGNAAPLQGPARATLQREIARSIAELDQLIDEILLASRIDAQEADLGAIEPVDLLGLAAEEAARAGAQLQLPTGGDGLVIPGVAKLLRRLIRNLLDNARRYGAPQGASAQEAASAITVSLQRQGQFVLLQVCDRGPGVPLQSRSRIFEPFYRLPGASEREGGVGLGLALVKSIAERHGGNVACEDRLGGGACFSVNLQTATNRGARHPLNEGCAKPTG